MGEVSIVTVTPWFSLFSRFYREGQGFILVYSIASRQTFERLEVFRQSMLRVKREETPIFLLVGNKADKAQEREVSREEGAELARQFGCVFMETSAKTAYNVETLFATLVRSLRNSRPEPRGYTIPTKQTNGNSYPPKKKRKCVIM